MKIAWPLALQGRGLVFWVLPACGLVCLWGTLIGHLSVEWSVNPQYGYGWAVPFLCAYILWERRREARLASGKGEDAGIRPGLARLGGAGLALCVLALLWLPGRLIQVANPQWRSAMWFVALIVVGITMLGLRLVFGPAALRRFAFPICFFLVAVPWPTVFEWPLIQGLTRADTALTIELLNGTGVPSFQRGNAIEINGGLVDVGEGCSGIRSFQAALMISLFLGEFRRLSVGRRILLCLGGFALAFLFNVGRTFFLSEVAAHRGISAVGRWHTPTGVALLLACFFGLWFLALALRSGRSAEAATGSSRFTTQEPGPLTPSLSPELGGEGARRAGEGSVGTMGAIHDRILVEGSRPATPPPAEAPAGLWRLDCSPGWLPAAVGAWILLVCVGVEIWFRAHEIGLPRNVAWRAVPPQDRPSVRQVPFSESALRTLRHSEAINVAWQEADGSRWQMIYQRWAPGRIAAHAAQGHSPEGCLTAAGLKLVSMSEVSLLEVNGLRLPFRSYVFQDGPRLLQVFFCVWQDRAREQYFERRDLLSIRSRLAGIWEGRRNLGQRSIELSVWGLEDARQTEAAAHRQLAKLIRVER